MRIFLLISLIVSAFTLSAKTYFSDPGKGSVTNLGTKESPWPSLEKIMSSGLKINPGDTLMLMSGNHGTVELKGINPNYIFILSAPGEKPLLSHLDIARTAPAVKWHVEGITFTGAGENIKEYITFFEKSMYVTISKCSFISEKNINEMPTDKIKSLVKKGIKISGSRHEISFNAFSGVSTAIDVNASKCKISGNRITDFTEHAILCEGSHNIFTNNLIKNFIYTGLNGAAFKTVSSADKPSDSNILLGNVIVDYTSPERKNIAPLMGIVGFDGSYRNWAVENNVIVTDHWHGITFFNISNSDIVNNSVIDPYLDTHYSNLPEEYSNKSFGPVRIWISKNEKGEVSSGNTIANNLASDYLIEDASGVNTNNIKVASSYAALDNYFEKWDYLDFHLRDSALAVNAGNNDYAPGIDADGTKRPIGASVNAGAYEYSYIEPGDQEITVVAANEDVELRNHNQKPDWNGQKAIRVGGVGAGFDGVMVMPFALPPLPAGFSIKSASLSVNLESIDNSPMGSINLHGLIPRKSPNVLPSDYYQGDIMGDLQARPIQQDFLGKKKGGMISTTQDGDKVLTNYLNALYESGAVGGDYVFLRLSPSSSDVKDYSRWVFSSADADDYNNRPKLTITIGKSDDAQTSDVGKHIIVSPDVLYDGNFKIIFVGDFGDEVGFELFDSNGEKVFNDVINKNEYGKMQYESKGKITLASGFYFIKINEIKKKFGIW